VCIRTRAPVGLCELVQHLAMADYVASAASMEDRAIEYVDHLHDTSSIRYASSGAVSGPSAPGFSAEMTQGPSRASLPRWRCWRESRPHARQAHRKRCLITAAAQGIGRETALPLRAKGPR